MMPIEHFLIAIMQISFRDWIENSIADIGREMAPTDIRQPTLRNFLKKKRSQADNVFSYGTGIFLVSVLHKKLTM